EIYLRASFLAARMIRHLIDEQIQPVPQTGEVVVFKRRTPEESRIPSVTDLDKLYDFIRMLDAEGYPQAFAELGKLKIELSRASLYSDRIVAAVTIRLTDEPDESSHNSSAPRR